MLNASKVKRNNKYYLRVKLLYEKAFPEKEKVPFSRLMFFTFRRGTQFLYFVDNDEFVGEAYIVLYRRSVYVFYLAVSSHLRGSGYGSEILSWIKENYEGMNIILDIEAIDEKASNYIERLKRIEFYRRNGIVDTKYRLFDNGILYMVLASSPQSFSPHDMTRCWRRYLFGLLEEKLFKSE